MPPTTHRTVRVAEEVWRPAAERAAAEGRTMTDVIVAHLVEYGQVSAPRRTEPNHPG